MNIFILSETHCPIESAEFQCDTHCRKMSIEGTQLLANVFSKEFLSLAPKTQTGNIRKHSHINHPTDKWVKESKGNFEWTIRHTRALFKEYTFRYKKRHFTETFLDWIEENKSLTELPDKGLTQFPIAINESMNCRKVEGFDKMPRFEQYRLYYRLDKPFTKWERGRNKPDWMNL